jgi:hypothetical protein
MNDALLREILLLEYVNILKRKSKASNLVADALG